MLRIVVIFLLSVISFSSLKADDLETLQITENTDPTIAELYNQLQTSRGKIESLKSEREDSLFKNFEAVRDNEQSFANRTLGAASTAAMGLGMMSVASAKSEQTADANAEQDMSAYLETFRCEYGKGQSSKAGNEEITLPGGNELLAYYTEYKSLADRLKNTKQALGLRPGIESEVLYDKAESGLYKYASTGITGGAFTSLSRALTDSEGKDAAALNAQKESSANKLKTGAIAAGAGAVGGIIGNAIINKDAPKEQSAKINQEYDNKIETASKESQDIEQQLNQAITENAQRVEQYNQELQQHKNLVEEINQSPEICQTFFQEYIATITPLNPVANKTDAVPDTEFPEINPVQDKLDGCNACDTKGGEFNPETNECPCPADKPIEKDGKCTEKPVEPVETETPISPEKGIIASEEIDEEPHAEPIPEPEPDENRCPATGNGLKSITDKHKVGDSCTSDIISQGTVTKRPNGTCTCRATGCWAPYTPNKSGKCVKATEDKPSAQGDNNEYVDANGYCKPYKSTNWFFNNENNKKVSEYFNKICNDFAKAHNCKRKDLNTGRLVDKEGEAGKPGYAFEYEYTCNATSEDYQASQERINQRNSNLTYENVCKTLGVDKTEKKNNISRACIGLFENLDISDFATQVEIVKAYTTERLGQSSIACSKSRDAHKNQATNNPDGYYIKCNTTDDSMRLTFIFKGIGDADQRTPASYASITESACLIHKVKYNSGNFCSYKLNLKNGKDATCEKINTFAQRVGYFAQAESGRGCVLYKANADYERGGGRVTAKKGERRTAYGIDNDMFANIETNMDYWLYDQMRIIVEKEMKNAGHSDPLMKFECFQRDNDNVLTCNANERPIDFAFKRLGHVSKRYANAAKEGLTCIFGSNGKYDGRKCWGLTAEKCTELNTEIKQLATNCPQCGTQWLPKPEPGTCSLTKSTKVEKTDVGLQIAGNAMVLATATIITIFTDGMTTPILVTTAAETTGLIVEATSSRGMRNVADQFLAKTQFCNNSQCAEELLDEDEVRRILNLETNLTDKQTNTIDGELARLLRLVSPMSALSVSLVNNMKEKPNCNFWKRMTAQCEMVQFINAWAQVVQFASLFHSMGRIASKLVKSRKAIIEMAEQTTKELTSSQVSRINDIDIKIASNNAKLKNPNLTNAERAKLRADNNAQRALREEILNENTPKGASGTTQGTGKTGASDANSGKSRTSDNSGNAGANGNRTNGSQNTGNSSNAGANGNRTNGSQNTGNSGTGNGNTSGGQSNHNGAGSASRGAASGATNGNKVHPDLEAWSSSSTPEEIKAVKRKLINKYHPDKVDKYKSEKLTDLATKITQNVNAKNIEDLTEAELRELSQQMDEFERYLKAAQTSAEEAARTAKNAQTTSAGAKKTGDAKSAATGTKNSGATTTEQRAVATTTQPKVNNTATPGNSTPKSNPKALPEAKSPKQLGTGEPPKKPDPAPTKPETQRTTTEQKPTGTKQQPSFSVDADNTIVDADSHLKEMLKNKFNYDIDTPTARSMAEFEQKFDIPNGLSLDDEMAYIEELMDDIQKFIDDSPKLAEKFLEDRIFAQNILDEYHQFKSSLEYYGYDISEPVARNMDEIQKKWGISFQYDDLPIEAKINHLDSQMWSIEGIFSNTKLDGIDELIENFRVEESIVMDEIERLHRLANIY